MKSHTLTESILKIAIIFILALACMNMSVLATDPNDPGTDPADPVEATPYINFEIKTTKVDDGSKQVLVECWGKDFENLVGLDFVFQYDNNKLTPSYLNEAGKINKVLNDLDTIQYVNRPEIQSDEESFLNNSRTILSDSFKLNSELVNIEEKPILKTYVLRYEESRFDGEDEIAKTIMVSISKNDLITQVSDDGTNPKGVKIGTFSFRLADGQSVSEEDFDLIRTLVMCDDGKTTDPNGEEDISLYERDITSADAQLNNIDEIAKFILGDEPTGSISGTIQTGYYLNNTYTVWGTMENITIRLYTDTQLEGIDLNVTGENYKTAKADLPDTDLEYVTTPEDSGTFKIEDVPYEKYTIIIHKDNYLDYIITDVIVDSNEEIDLNEKLNSKFGSNNDDGDAYNIELIPGDVTGDGIINNLDKVPVDQEYKRVSKLKKTDDKTSVYDFNDDKTCNALDKTAMGSAYKLATLKANKNTKYQINTIVSIEAND